MNNLRKTKIICTLGPASNNEKTMRELILAGMDVARFNFSHGSHEQHKETFMILKRLREELDRPIAALLDTKGPEIRVGLIENGKIELEKGQTLILTTEECVGTAEKIGISYKGLPLDIKDGGKILIDDGLIELKIISHNSVEIKTEVINGGIVSDRKGINVPGVRLSMPYLSEQDKADILFGAETGFDFIAASFTRSGDDIEAIKALLGNSSKPDMRIIAKIENSEGVLNIDDILRVADGVMVARGDMGVEIAYEEIPVLQKMLIHKCYNAGKQVITATQMLDSMIKNPRPTRAETTDVANAIYDGTSAIMLSGETAAGLYPVETLKTMANIATRAEQDIDYAKRFRQRDMTELPNITNAISHATVTTALDLNAAAIVTVTKTGQTARMISKYRPKSPIIGCSTSETVVRQMNLSWGVTPLLCEEKYTNDELFDHAVDTAQKAGLIKNSDLVVITAGIPLGIAGTTNILKVHIVGNILITGHGVNDKNICAPLCVCKNATEAHRNFKNGDILVIPKTDNGILELIKDCAGLITEQDGINSHGAIVGLALDKPVIVGAANATTVLRGGTVVTLDATRGIVCNMTKRGID